MDNKFENMKNNSNFQKEENILQPETQGISPETPIETEIDNNQQNQGLDIEQLEQKKNEDSKSASEKEQNIPYQPFVQQYYNNMYDSTGNSYGTAYNSTYNGMPYPPYEEQTVSDIPADGVKIDSDKKSEDGTVDEYPVYPAEMMTLPKDIEAVKPQKEKKRDKKGKKLFSITQLVASVLVTALVCGVVMNVVTDKKIESKMLELTSVSASDSDGSTATHVSTATGSTAAVAKKVADSVVGIRVTTVGTPSFFGTSESSSEGSGVVYTKDGYIITNYHVISSAIEQSQTQSNSFYDFFGGYGSQGGSSSETQAKIEVFLNGDTDTGYEAEIIGYDASVDLAVLKIDKTDLQPVEIGNSDTLSVGDVAIAIGNPGGLDFMGSVSQGIISGLNRTIVTENGTETNLIQTDAAINPGNSGGALCDSSGRLIGINNSKMSGEDYEGMGFSIPVNTVVEVCDGIMENKDKPQPYLGISASTQYTSDVLKYYGLPEGVLVASCVSGSPAENAGIQAYDIITEIDGVAITSYDQLNSEKNKHEVGDTISLKVYRSGSYYDVDVTLGTTY